MKKATWKVFIEKALDENYKGVSIKWNNDDPTLVIPDEMIGQADEIVEFVKKLTEIYGGKFEFYPEKSVRT